jgi:uncharacterized protein YjbI with pentapeptide repeats
MSKTFEMKKSSFLKKIEGYLFQKKETPLKLYTTPGQLSALRIKFVFARLHEVVLMPSDLSFFTAQGDRWEAENSQGIDAGKTYHFRFCAPLLKELTKTRVFVGRSTQEKFEALSTYLNGIRDNKVIFEVAYGVDLNLTPRTVRSDASFNLTPRSLASDITHRSVASDQLVLHESGGSAFTEACPREGGELAAALPAAASALLIETRKEEAADEEGKRDVEGQRAVIEGLESELDAYRKLAAQGELKFQESSLKIASLEQALRDSDVQLQALEAEKRETKEEQDRKVAAFDDAAALAQGKITSLEQTVREMELNLLQARRGEEEARREQARLEQAFLEQTRLEQDRLSRVRLEQTRLERARRERVRLEQTRLEETRLAQARQEREAADGAAADDDSYEIKDGDEGEKDDSIDNLIEEIMQEDFTHLSTVIGEWKDALLKSRMGVNTLDLVGSRGLVHPLYGTKKEDAQADPNAVPFAVLARLEGERAAHVAANNTPWPREQELATLRSEGFGFDLQCLSIYQRFPRDLKAFMVLFIFWELAHHERFYRNALGIALNGGRIPDTLGIPEDANPTDTMLKLMHSTEILRILMGHYAYIAHHQFGMDVFIPQPENKARFQASLFQGATGEQVDISRTLAEARDYI